MIALTYSAEGRSWVCSAKDWLRQVLCMFLGVTKHRGANARAQTDVASQCDVVFFTPVEPLKPSKPPDYLSAFSVHNAHVTEGRSGGSPAQKMAVLPRSSVSVSTSPLKPSIATRPSVVSKPGRKGPKDLRHS